MTFSMVTSFLPKALEDLEYCSMLKYTQPMTKKLFPFNMGYCQRGSNLAYDSTMNLRKILWLAPMPSNSSKSRVAPGVLVVLDARPDGIIYRALIPDYVQIARTLYEDDFGEVAVDVNYLNVGGASSPNYQIFIC